VDTAGTVGAVLAGVCGGGCGVRPAAARAGVPYTTARGWVRRFAARAPAIGAAFAALAAELGGPAITGPAGAGPFALGRLGAAFAAAAALPGWAGPGAWRAGGLNALKPAERSDTGTARAHPELFAEAAALRLELPGRSAAQIASILYHRHGVKVSERTVRGQLRRAGLHREALAAEPKA